jgi:golgi apparatus protein 1
MLSKPKIYLQARPTCRQELFRYDVEAADDLRLNVRLFNACKLELSKFCEGQSPGSAAGHSCLEQNRHDANFGDECRCAPVVFW